MSTLDMVSEAVLADSQRYCQQLTRARARNFYYGLKLLPPAKRAAMFALYAYMRKVDDIADAEDGETGEGADAAGRLAALEAWADATHAAIAGHPASDGDSVWPAFADLLHRFSIPRHVFEEVIAGLRQDLSPTSFPTFAELRDYCYRVAGVIGVASIHVWGFTGGAATEALAIDRGIAFQLTNILRDLREDAGRQRVYIPRDELAAANLADRSPLAWDEPPRESFDGLMRKQIERAESFYQSSRPLEDCISADCRPTLRAMTQIYHGLLEAIAADPARVLHERVRLSSITKMRIAWQAVRSR